MLSLNHSQELKLLFVQQKLFNFDGVFFHLSYLRFITSGSDVFDPSIELADLEQCRLYK